MAADTTAVHRVAVFAAPDDVHDLSRVLVAVLGMHPTDAAVHARYAPGVLPDRLPAGQAAELAGAIEGIGIRAEAIAAESIPEFEHAEVVHHVRCLDAGLEILEFHGAEECVVPWGEIELVSIGQVPLETSRHYVGAEGASVISAARRTAPGPVDRPLPAGPEAWIIRREPLRGFRIDHKRMNYEYLGTRKSDSATANFRLLIDDIIAQVPETYLPPATRAFLEHGPVTEYSFESQEALKRYTVLHLLVHRQAGT